VSKLVATGGVRFGLVVTLAVLATWLGAGPGHAMPPEGGSVAHEVIVGFNHGASALQRHRAVREVDGHVKKRLQGIGAALVGVPGKVGPAVDRLEKRAGVRYAEPNFLVSTAAVPNDPGFGQLWGLDNVGQLINFAFGTPDADIDAREAWDVTTGGSTVVGILDTGVDMSHPDLAANVWRNPGENCAGCRNDGIDNDGNGYVDDWRGWDFANDDNDPTDDHGHGTHVAGTIGAVGGNGLGVAGVNWSAQLMPLKFIGADGNGTTADAIDAITYAAENGAAVTNNSYVSPDFSQAFADAVAFAGERGSLLVAAAGNSSSSNDQTPQYPASFTSPNVISVAATNNRDQRSFFSNYGAGSVDLGAPGESIYSTWVGGGFQFQSGTSMASPHVAGAAALAESALPGSSPAAIKALLLDTVDPNASLAGRTTSGGRLNVNAAVRCGDSGQAWIESPGPGFVARIGETLHVTALAGRCGRAAGVTVTAEANGAPLALTPRAGGAYDGDYTVAEPGPLSISVTAQGPGGTDVRTVSGTVPDLIVPGGLPVTVTAASPDENPRLVFEGHAGQRVSLDVSGVTMGSSTCCGAKVSITAPDGSKVVSPTNVGTRGDFLDATTLPQSGTYNILVDPQGSATGSATLTLYDVPPDAAADIEPDGAAVSVATTTPGQNAALRFDADPGDRVSVQVASLCCSARVSIVAPDGSPVGSQVSMNSSGGFIDTRALSQGGTYKILVDPQGAVTGAATLSLYGVPPDAAAAIVPGGAPVSVQTTTPGQNAAVTFAADAGDRVSLKAGPLCCSTRVSIVAPDGSTALAPTLMSSSGGFVEPVTLQRTGTYRIVLDPQGATTGSATLSLYEVPPDSTAPIVAGGAAVSAQVGTPGQNARLTFAGAAGQVVSLSAGPLCCTSKLSLVAPDGSPVVPPTLMGTSGGFVDATKLPKAGTYTIVMDPQGAATGNSTLRLFDVPPDAAAQLALSGPSVPLATTTPGQNARLTFAGVAGRRASLNLAPTCCATAISVLAPDGTEIAEDDSITTTGLFLEPWTLPQSGTYTIAVDPKAAAKGSMTFSAYDVPPDLAATTTIGGAAVTLALTTPGLNATVRFDGTAGRAVTVQVSGVTITQSKVSVTNPDGTNLVSPGSVYTSGKTLTTQLVASGTHTILLNPVGAYVGNMTVAVR